MVRLAAELLLILGLLLLTLHITVLRGSGAADGPDAAAGNASRAQLQVSARGSWARAGGRVYARRRVLHPTANNCAGSSSASEALLENRGLCRKPGPGSEVSQVRAPDASEAWDAREECGVCVCFRVPQVFGCSLEAE